MRETAIQQLKALPWYREINNYQWRTLILAILGYALDAMDFLMYAMVIGPIMKEFEISPATAGFLATVVLMAASAGGYIFGVLTDYIGRARTLIITVLLYSIGTFFSAFSGTWVQLLFWRVLLGLGMGGEWGPGMALVVETWPIKHRAKAVAMVQSAWPIGYFLAVITASLIVPVWGWRGLFMVGVLPAIFVSIARWRLTEPEIWERARKGAKRMFAPVELFTRRYLYYTIWLTIIAILGNLGYYAFSIWVPTLLSGPIAKGGFALPRSTVTNYLIISNIILFIGYPIFGFLADRYGRRTPFVIFGLIGATGMTIYSLSGTSINMLIFGIMFASISYAYYTGFGLMISELYDTRVRGSALGFIFNTGRMVGGQAPLLVGWMAASMGLARAALIAVPGLILMVIFVAFIPETRGKELDVT